MRFLSSLPYLLIGYLVGVWMAPALFSMTVTLTAWANIWVYVYILFWPAVLMLAVLKWVIIIGVIWLAIWALAMKFGG